MVINAVNTSIGMKPAQYTPAQNRKKIGFGSAGTQDTFQSSNEPWAIDGCFDNLTTEQKKQ
jgi:hypothetical protein